ncbi:MAG: phosphoenolpyruvate kinase [Calditrichaeota bacterium]|nr:MAG: phosphoenolpyruvate kinase [Calditrichota bacterium]MBL1205057.1 phosphoenolpyruvate kinase [Calditrichota bacterium]NOG44887.1 phosphoenolpyruvate kinase [Calditrichota bacterium]
MKLSIPESAKEKIFTELKTANIAFQNIYPGDRHDRQPVHTVYGGANLFKSDSIKKMNERALKTLKTNAPDFVEFAKVLMLEKHDQLPDNASQIKALKSKLENNPDQKNHPAWLSFAVYNKVIEKLKREAVEDFRIDFEDGFGNRRWPEEDETAVFTAKELAKGMNEKTISPFVGIRIKPFTEDLKERGARTLDIFVTTLLAETNGALPDNFVVMLPKVTIPEQVTAIVHLFEILEKVNGLPANSLKMEIMVETTQAIMNDEGTNSLMRFIRASKGRCIATHFGTYDYTASCDITAKYQTMAHPVCDFAHHVTRVALGHTGIWLSDGATNVMPVGPHRGENLSESQLAENKRVVHRAWKMGYDHVRHSLFNGFYQGWDLHPSQLPVRYAAVYAFFLESYEDAAMRLKKFVEQAARATLTGDVFDDAATGQGLLNYFLRALNCGAISVDEALATGLTIEEFRSRSFLKILEGRRK